MKRYTPRWSSGGRTTESTLNTWRERSFEALERRCNSSEFRAVFDEHHEVGPELSSANRTMGTLANAVGKAGTALGKATRNVVYQVGKALRVKFKPWGAFKLAGRLGKVSVVLAAAGVVLDSIDFVLEEARYKKREEERKKIARFLQESVPRVVETFAFGEEEKPGILKELERVIGTMKRIASDQSGERDDLMVRMDNANHKRTIYAELISDACRRLGNPWEVHE